MELLENVKEYFKNTSKEQIKKDWDKTSDCDGVGPTVSELFEAFKHNPTTVDINKAFEYYNNHKDHVNKMLKSLTIPGYPPSIEDQNSPDLWKAQHWDWFLKSKYKL